MSTKVLCSFTEHSAEAGSDRSDERSRPAAGRQVAGGWQSDRAPYYLETSVPGVFAAGHWAQEAPGSDPGAPNAKPFNWLTFFRSQFMNLKALA
jgi:hypothetical protein